MRFHFINDGGNTLLINDRVLAKLLKNIETDTTHGNVLTFDIMSFELDEEEEGKRLDFKLLRGREILEEEVETNDHAGREE